MLDEIVPNVRKMRFSKTSLSHLMNAYQEGFEALLSGAGIDPLRVTILSGCELNGGTLSQGWAAYGGEFFQVDAVNLSSDPSPNTFVWTLAESFLDTDPVQFDDGNEFNVNRIRKLALIEGVSGSGIADHTDVVYLNSKWTDLNLMDGWQMHGGSLIYLQNGIPSYRIDRAGNLHLVGVIKSQNGVGSSHIATLPINLSRNLTITGRAFPGSTYEPILMIYANGELHDINRDSRQANFFALTGVSIPVI